MMERETDRQALINLIINAKRTDPETGSFTEWLADFLLGYGLTLPQPSNEPLTMEELRGMNGEPVWWDDGEKSCWGIISVDTNGRWEGIPLKEERDAAIHDMTSLMAGHCCNLCAVEHCNDRGKTEMCTAFKWCDQMRN